MRGSNTVGVQYQYQYQHEERRIDRKKRKKLTCDKMIIKCFLIVIIILSQ